LLGGPAQQRTRDELRGVVGAQERWRTTAADRQALQPLAVGTRIEHEVVAPDLVRRCRSLVSVWPAPYCAEADDIRWVCSRRESFGRTPEGGDVSEGEIITRRRKWEPAQKSALLDEVEAESGSSPAARHLREPAV
jgi:hypothetical protein